MPGLPKKGSASSKKNAVHKAAPQAVALHNWCSSASRAGLAFRKFTEWFFLSALLVCCLRTLHANLLILHYPYEANFGEGGLLYDAVRLARGETIYGPAAKPGWLSPYPPLFAWAVSIWPAPDFFWPRLISQVSHVISSVSLAIILRSFRMPWRAALAAALFWFSNPFLRTFAAMGRVDSFGRMLESISLLIAVWATATPRKIWGAAFFSALGMCTKQTMFASALTLGMFWGKKNKKMALQLLLAWLSLTLLCYIIIAQLLGKHFFFNVFFDVRRPLNIEFLWPWLLGFVVTNVFLLLLAAIGLRLALRDSAGWFFLCATIAGIPSVLLAAQDGADVNYFFDITWGLCGLAAVGVFHMTAESGLWRHCLLTGVTLGILAFEWLVPPRHPLPDQLQRARDFSRLLEAAPKPVLTEFVGFGLRAKSKPSAVPYIDRLLHEAGVRSADALVKQIESHSFGAIQITNQAGARWPKSVLQALEKHYREEYVFPNMFASEGEPTFYIFVPNP